MSSFSITFPFLSCFGWDTQGRKIFAFHFQTTFESSWRYLETQINLLRDFVTNCWKDKKCILTRGNLWNLSRQTAERFATEITTRNWTVKRRRRSPTNSKLIRNAITIRNQCDQTWRNFANLARFKYLGQSLEGSIKILNPMWEIFFSIGQILNLVNGQIFNK